MMQLLKKKILKDKHIDGNLIFKNILDNTSDFIIVFNKNGDIIEFNKNAQKSFGYTQKEAFSKNENDLFRGNFLIEKIKNAFKQDKKFKGIIEFRKKDNSKLINIITAFEIKDENLNEIGYTICGKSIDKLEEISKKVEKTEKIYKDIIENSTDLIQVIDLKGNFTLVNNTWLKTLGYTQTESIKLNIDKVLGKQNNYYKKFDFVKDILTSNRSKPKVVFFKDKKGNEYILEGNSTIEFYKGKPIAIRSIFRNITEVRRTWEKLKINSARLNAVFNNSTHLFWIVNKRICLTAFNENFAEAIKDRYGVYPELNIDYSSPKNNFSNTKKHVYWNNKYEKAFNGNVVKFVTETKLLNGEIEYRETFLNPIILPNGEIEEVSGIAHDITKKKVAEKELKEQTAKINSIFESASNMLIFTFDKDFKMRSYNKRFYNYLIEKHGITIEKGMVMDYREFPALSVQKEALGKTIKRAFNGKHSQIELSIIDLEGNKEWFEVIFNPVYFNVGKISEVSCLAFEITKSKETENKLRNTVKEKEILLKEVHHRVKNNLQVISSILSLQASYVADKKTLDILKESQDRIKTMSFVHERLYQNSDFSSIKIGEYILSLVKDLIYSYKTDENEVKLKAQFDNIYLNLDQAIPCGLIVNELVSNALKHAFKQTKKGKLNINIKKKKNKIELKISDNGIGLPDKIVTNDTETLGFQLVHALVDQLDGTIKLNRSKGTEYLINFEALKD
jgi:PAS domain S-box-containing protein